VSILRKLVVFDVDGILWNFGIEGGFIKLAKKFGHAKEVEEIHKEYLKRKKFGPWGLERLASLFKGDSYDKAKKVVEKFPLVKGVREVINELKKRNYVIVAFSSNPTVILEVLQKKLNFDYICGNVLEVKNGKFTGKLTKKVDRYQKTNELKKLIKKLSLSKKDVYIIGDSITDIPMAKEGTFIVFNPKDEVEEYADHVVKSNDLRDVLRYVR